MSRNHNPSGKNQHGKSIMVDGDFWCPILQKYLDEGVKQKQKPKKIEREHNGLQISQRSIERLISKFALKTARQPRIDAIDMGAAILDATEEDPLGKWGIRQIQEELKLDGTHLPRKFIEDFQRTRAPEEATARFFSGKKIRRKGLVSPGPNEEWCVDGHAKLQEKLGIDVWGIIDKYARRELGLWAIPNSRLAIVPPALFLMLVKEKKGVPLQVTSDKGSETGQLAALQTALRTHYEPGLSVEDLPPHQFVKSVRNITRERTWRLLWEQEFQNILFAWTDGQLEVRYTDGNPTHRMIGCWLWARVVQGRLDRHRLRNGIHRVRLQKNVVLPTGGRHADFYDDPEALGGEDMLIPVDEADIDRLLAEHVPERLFQFGTDESHDLAMALFEKVGSPAVTLRNAWSVWREMMDVLQEIEDDAEAPNIQVG